MTSALPTSAIAVGVSSGAPPPPGFSASTIIQRPTPPPAVSTPEPEAPRPVETPTITADPTRAAAIWYARDQGLTVIPVHRPVSGPAAGEDGAGVCSCGKQFTITGGLLYKEDPSMCSSAGKHPVREGWSRDPSAQLKTEAEILTEWRDDQTWNIGLPTGPDHGLMVIDVDARSGGLGSITSLTELVAADAGPGEPWELTGTMTYFTSGWGGARGYHLLFKVTDPDVWRVLEKPAATPLPGVELKRRGQQVVAAPSVHATGVRYERPRAGTIVLKELTITEAERLVASLDAIRRIKNPDEDQLSAAGEMHWTPVLRAWFLGEKVEFEEGTRDNALTGMCGALVRLMVPNDDKPLLEHLAQKIDTAAYIGEKWAPDYLLDLMLAINTDCCKPEGNREKTLDKARRIFARHVERSLENLDGAEQWASNISGVTRAVTKRQALREAANLGDSKNIRIGFRNKRSGSASSRDERTGK